MGNNLLFQKPVVSEFGLFYISTWLICQKFGLFFETTGFETTGFSTYRLPRQDKSSNNDDNNNNINNERNNNT